MSTVYSGHLKCFNNTFTNALPDHSLQFTNCSAAGVLVTCDRVGKEKSRWSAYDCGVQVAEIGTFVLPNGARRSAYGVLFILQLLLTVSILQ